jgi:DNA-binding transcriptional LysR family regulator
MDDPPAHDPLSASFSTSYANVVAFMAVVVEGSFAKAASRLGVDRSAVSRSVKRLEEHLGVRLLRRTTRSLSLTSEGELLHDQCRPGIEQIGQAFELLRELRDGPPQGTLRIGAEVDFGRRVIAPLLPAFQSAYPGIGLDVVLDDMPVNFIDDRIDVRFQRGPLADGHVVARRLMPLDLTVCATPSYFHWHGVPLTPEDLRRHRCVGRRLPNGRLQDWEFSVQGRLLRQRVTPRHIVNDDELLARAVGEGLGIGQLPGHLVRDRLADGSLVRCLEDHAVEDAGYELCYPRRTHMPTRVRVFIDHIAAALPSRGGAIGRIRESQATVR